MAEQLGPVHSAFHHTVYGRPVGQAAQTAVVYEKIHTQLAGDAGVCEIGNGRSVAVHRVEIKPVIVAELDSILQKPAFTGCPEYQLVPFLLQFFQHVEGEGTLLANVRVAMFDNGSVEVNSNGHQFSSLLFSP